MIWTSIVANFKFLQILLFIFVLLRLKTNSSSSNEDIKSSLDDIDANLEEHIARLIEERDTLLKTGVYSNRDSIIIELDRKIRDGMNQVKK